MTSLIGTRVNYYSDTARGLATGVVVAIGLDSRNEWSALIRPDRGGRFEQVLATMCDPVIDAPKKPGNESG